MVVVHNLGIVESSYNNLYGVEEKAKGALTIFMVSLCGTRGQAGKPVLTFNRRSPHLGFLIAAVEVPLQFDVVYEYSSF